VRALLPDDVELAARGPRCRRLDLGRLAVLLDGSEELLDPARSQYKEAFAVVRCRSRA
jgi:acetoacetate decarboxylase